MGGRDDVGFRTIVEVGLGVRSKWAAHFWLIELSLSKGRVEWPGGPFSFLVQGNPSPGESSRRWSLTMCSSSSEEVILAEDETDGEQRHPFDGNCSEPGSRGGGGSQRTQEEPRLGGQATPF